MGTGIALIIGLWTTAALLSLTLPAWRARVGEPVVVISLRSPGAVAASLAHRDHMPAELAAFLWARYTHAAIEVSAGLPRLLVDYVGLLAVPETTIDALLGFLAANGMDVDPARRAAALAFLSPKLKHAAGGTPASGDNDALYRQLLAASPRVPTLAASVDPPDTHSLERYQALRMILSRQLDVARERADRFASALRRVEHHVISGTVIRALRRLKRDPGFGTP